MKYYGLLVAVLLLCATTPLAITQFLRSDTAPAAARGPVDLRMAGMGSDAILLPGEFERLPTSLRQVKALFAVGLEEAQPIRSEGNFYFGSGCKAHECGGYASAWLIDRRNGASVAVIMESVMDPGVSPEHLRFNFFGASGLPMPRLMESWCSAHGGAEDCRRWFKSPQRAN